MSERMTERDVIGLLYLAHYDSTDWRSNPAVYTDPRWVTKSVINSDGELILTLIRDGAERKFRVVVIPYVE